MAMPASLQAQRLVDQRLGLHREAAAMAGEQAAAETAFHRQAGDPDQRARLRVAPFVDMQIEVEPALLGEGEYRRCRSNSGGTSVGTAARSACRAKLPADIGHHIGELCRPAREEDVDRADARRLQIDAAGPFVAQRPEHRQGRLRLRARANPDGSGSRRRPWHRRSASRTRGAAGHPRRPIGLAVRAWSSSPRHRTAVRLAARGQMWPLSRWAWRSRRPAST